MRVLKTEDCFYVSGGGYDSDSMAGGYSESGESSECNGSNTGSLGQSGENSGTSEHSVSGASNTKNPITGFAIYNYAGGENGSN